MTSSTSRRALAGLAVFVLAWLVLGGGLGSYAGRLAEVQQNDSASFLPAGAEATRVIELQAAFAQGDVLPAVVVYERVGGVTPADVAAATAHVEEVADLPALLGEPSPPLPSADGEALQVVVPLSGDDGDALTAAVETTREVVADVPAGLDVAVTGPAGVLADFTVAFERIDGLLVVVTASVVALILVLVYRSPVLPLVVLLGAVLALGTASALVYGLARGGVITLNGQGQGILFILVFGASTDYALLYVARFREELRRSTDRVEAARLALRGTIEPILASGGTVILGVLCLLVSDLNSNRSLGPVAALGVLMSLLVMLTFLPAALALLGRAAFWPFRPVYGEEPPLDHGLWGRVAGLVGRRPRAVWVSTALVLAVAAAFAPQLRADGVSQTDFFLTEVESVRGQDVLAAHFPAGAGSPAVVIAREEALAGVLAAAAEVEGVAGVDPLAVPAPVSGGPPDLTSPPPTSARPVVVDGLVLVQATLTDPADSAAAVDTVRSLRAAVREVPGAEALVGGQTAIQLDTLETSQRDLRRIIPLVLGVIVLVLAALLRAVVAPLLLVATVVLSFASTLGVGALLFEHVFDFPGSDPAVPLFAFVFLVALGIDYNIFLMTRVREESEHLGTRPGVLRGLAVTGGVITSAGVVLAATFSALWVIPILFLAQIAFLVAFGVLLDALVVRSLLVPALTHDLGGRVWWPSRLSRR